MNILVNPHGISSQVYPQTNFLISHMYTKIHSNQPKIILLTLIHFVHTFNKYTFGLLLCEACYNNISVGKFIRKQFTGIIHAVHWLPQS